MKIIELREYKIKQGKTQEWLDWMRDEILPYQRSKGMVILNTYVRSEESGSDYFVWLREFANEQARQCIYEKTYNDWWIINIRPKVFTLIEESSVNVKLLKPVDL